MLVLSRRAEECIVFPNVGITIKILRVDRRGARVGISAPSDIRILREEVAPPPDETLNSRLPRQDLHAIRNRLNTVNLGVHLYRQQLEAGFVEAANATFLRLVDDLERIDRAVGAEVGECEEEEPQPRVPFRLLVVEDDARQRELLAGFLKIRGCEVATATDGVEALSYLSTHEWPDFLLLDLRMPNCDGAQMLKQVRESCESPNLKIFAVSGTSPEDLGITTGPGGVDDWFPKPLNPEGLIQRMIQMATPPRPGLAITA